MVLLSSENNRRIGYAGAKSCLCQMTLSSDFESRSGNVSLTHRCLDEGKSKNLPTIDREMKA